MTTTYTVWSDTADDAVDIEAEVLVDQDIETGRWETHVDIMATAPRVSDHEAVRLVMAELEKERQAANERYFADLFDEREM